MNGTHSAVFSLSLLLALCAASKEAGAIQDFASVFEHPGSYEDQWITVRGFVGVDHFGHKYLFQTLHGAKEKSYKDSLDLIAVIPGREDSMNALVDTACADIYGEFNSYGEHGVMRMGNLASDAGLITVERVSACPN